MTRQVVLAGDVTVCPVCKDRVHLDKAWHDRRRGVGVLVHYDCLTVARKREIDAARRRLQAA